MMIHLLYLLAYLAFGAIYALAAIHIEARWNGPTDDLGAGVALCIVAWPIITIVAVVDLLYKGVIKSAVAMRLGEILAAPYKKAQQSGVEIYKRRRIDEIDE